MTKPPRADASLPPPPNSREPKAREVLRVWEQQGHPVQVVLEPRAFADRNGRVDVAAWGILLADIARHVANAYRVELGIDPANVLERIRQGFDAEWKDPTDNARVVK
jgi:hypothetical protein